MKSVLYLLLLFLFPCVCFAQTLEEALGYGLPVIVVNTENGEEPTAERVVAPEGCLGKSIINATKVPGRLKIYYPGNTETPVFDSGEYEKDKSGMTIKLHGNTSALRTKNPFKIKLQKKADLLMRGNTTCSDRDWVLLRPTGGIQQSCPIVSMVGYKVTEILHVAEWVPACMNVNLIVNGDYRGFYQLTETVKRNEKCRINVDESKGYISEIDPYWWNEEVSVGSSILNKNNFYRFTFKYPDSDDITDEELETFRDYLDKLDASLIKGTYPLYIDVESCSRWLLAHQLLGTEDAAGSNIFIIRRDNQSKLQMGTLWDFDSSFRIQGRFTSVLSSHYFKNMLYDSPNKMLAREMIRIWTSERERILSEIEAFYESLAGSEQAQTIDKSTESDFERWHKNALDDMETTIQKLRSWFPAKAEDLDSLMQTLYTTDGDIQWQDVPEGTFALNGAEQPRAGSSLTVSSSMGDLSSLTFKWTRGDAFGVYEDSDILSTSSSYTITESDYERWLRVEACDNAGRTAFSKCVWISKLPVLYIDTEDGNSITSKENYVVANLRIQGNAEYEQQFMGLAEVRGRGATSWAKYPQKPYKLKLGKKTKLFGFPKSKHWALISNFNDKSCLRNYTASRLAKQLGVLGMEMTWVDVVLNGEVQGCYMLSQHVRVDKTCVDVFDWEEEAEDIADALFDIIKDADVLAETDRELLEETMKQNLSWITDGIVVFNGKTYNLSDYGLKKEYDVTEGFLFEGTDKTNGTWFATPKTVQFKVCRPEYLSTNSEMLSYVKQLWTDFETEYCQVAPAEGKDFAKYADMESMVGLWLANEIMGQDDQHNSRFSYIPGDKKIHFGPVWDFDHGGGSWSVTTYTDVFYTLYRNKRYAYYRQWFPDPFLCQMAYDAYWNVGRPYILDYISEGGEMDAKYALFAEAGRTNDMLWGDKPNAMNPSAAPRTTAEDVEILRTFLRNHIKWLDRQFASIRTLVEAMNKVCAYPCDPDIIIDSLQELNSEKHSGAHKLIRTGHLYIIKDGKTYSPDGKRVR